MHKSYKKTVAILVTCALIGSLFCFPVSASATDFDNSFVIDSVSMGLSSSGIYSSSFSYDRSTGVLNCSRPSEFSNMSGYGYIYIIFKFNGIDYSASNPLNFHFDIIRNSSGTMQFLDTHTDGRGIFGRTGTTLYDSEVRIGTCEISSDKLNVDVIATNVTQKYTSFVLRAYCYFNNYSTYSFKITNKDLYLSNPIIDNQNANTDKIIANQNSNTDKEIQADKENTQAIIDNQNELAEQEKQEIQNSGNQATDAADSIPNESEGFINALGTFVSTMSTTDTACSITFPAIKTPSFAGIPAATLSEEKEVDFSAAISLIPSDIMKLIQALTTIALIVFCFKELYDTISEALTRKKANSDG